MTTDRSCLLAAIRANPADDTPRLVFADWLDETAGLIPCRRCGGRGLHLDGMFRPHELPTGFGPEGQLLWNKRCSECGGKGEVSDGNRDRAEFIRIQIETARLVGVACKCGLERVERVDPGAFRYGCDGPRCRWLSREHELLHANNCHYAREWFCHQDHPLCGHLQAVCGGPTLWVCNVGGPDFGRCGLVVSRGFVAEVLLELTDFNSHAAALFRDHPVERVVLTDREPTDYGRRDSSTVVFWEPGFQQQAAHQIPFELAEAAGWEADFPMPGLMAYPFANRDGAHAALSAACLAWARTQPSVLAPG